uniref:Saposin A-type domain-containing protein n=1 Tax=Ditylenchus dipsaci TaxID=166011 RepID=A0A915EUZ6_9BILA
MWLYFVLVISASNLVRADPETNDLVDLEGHVVCERVPPSLWCSSEKLASECGFTEQCEKYTKASKNKPILLTLLYESLCPDCQNFISDFFRNTYHKIKDFIQLELVPFGNARTDKNSTIICQHGQPECIANKYESCAIHYMPEPLPFIYCLETQLQNQVNLEKAARKCYSKFHTKPHIYDQIVHCFNGQQGIDLQIKAAQRTEKIWPETHLGVPFMLFNNVSVQSQQFLLRDLNTAICQWYVGEKQPEGCNGMAMDLK